MLLASAGALIFRSRDSPAPSRWALTVTVALTKDDFRLLASKCLEDVEGTSSPVVADGVVTKVTRLTQGRGEGPLIGNSPERTPVPHYAG